mgnify:CR=1 FL=1
MSGWMLVFRGVDTTTPIDNADTNAAYAAPSTPFTVTITGIDPTTDGAFVVAAWTSVDNNTWNTLTSGWTKPSSRAQLRNSSGTDTSQTIAYKEVASGSSGNVAQNQATLGGDAGSTHIVAIRPVIVAGGTTEPGWAGGGWW